MLAPEWRSKPSWQGGWGWVATTAGTQLKRSPAAGRLVVVGDVQTVPTPNCSSPYEHQLNATTGNVAVADVPSPEDPPNPRAPGKVEGAAESTVGRSRDGQSCSQSWVMYSDDHGASWNYSRTLLHPGDESVAAELANGSLVSATHSARNVF